MPDKLPICQCETTEVIHYWQLTLRPFTAIVCAFRGKELVSGTFEVSTLSMQLQWRMTLVESKYDVPFWDRVNVGNGVRNGTHRKVDKRPLFGFYTSLLPFLHRLHILHAPQTTNDKEAYTHLGRLHSQKLLNVFQTSLDRGATHTETNSTKRVRFQGHSTPADSEPTSSDNREPEHGEMVKTIMCFFNDANTINNMIGYVETDWWNLNLSLNSRV